MLNHNTTTSTFQDTPEFSTPKALLLEIAYEVCNQVGGIYTVIRSKVPSMQMRWGDNYVAIGPYFPEQAAAIFEPEEEEDSIFAQVANALRAEGIEVHIGRWLISGRPKVILFNPYSVYHRLGEIKYLLWEHHDISIAGDDDLLNRVVAFGYIIKLFVAELTKPEINSQPVIAHIHEWMAATAIPEIRRDRLPVRLVFTTHATLLGRYLAMNDGMFYDHLPFYDWLKEARHFNIETPIRIERAAAHGSHIFTTVSEVTARECEVFLGRKPDLILPNGLNVRRYEILHEIQNIHQRFKDEIHQFVMGHFFGSYSFDLDKTLYFFTSGRFEFRNKGYDLTLEALARLNWRMKQANLDQTVVMFFITRQPYHSINPHVLNAQAQMQKIAQICEGIEKEVGDKLFFAAATSPNRKLPDLNTMVSDFWRLRLRRNLQSWQTNGLPAVVTHNLINDGQDQILNYLRSANLINLKEDKVKIVYHPDFISPASPLLAMEYSDFVRGCHLGIFPSHYEPWGYTPLECMVSGVAAVTSDQAGFGDYFQSRVADDSSEGVLVVNRRGRNYEDAANQLADWLFDFVQMSRRDRIQLRYQVESAATHFAWAKLTRHYDEAYNRVMEMEEA